MTDQPPPACPQCGNRKGIQQIAETYKCPRCGGLFDDDPLEGGSHYSDPAKRLEKEEEHRARKNDRLNGRKNRKTYGS